MTVKELRSILEKYPTNSQVSAAVMKDGVVVIDIEDIRRKGWTTSWIIPPFKP